MAKQTPGRCLDCGALVLVEVTKGKPAAIPPHVCSARACEYEGCRVRVHMEEMFRFARGEWYCPSHGLLVAARDLVLLYRAYPESDWTGISEIIVELLPALIAKAEAREQRRAS